MLKFCDSCSLISLHDIESLDLINEIPVSLTSKSSIIQ